MPQVQVIQPIQQQPKRLRVAAYARVSSDSEDQLNSLSVQVDYYTHLIQENPNWDFAGIYRKRDFLMLTIAILRHKGISIYIKSVER